VRALAFLVHILTASGAVLALFALIAATRDEWPLMFLLLGCALIVDAVDGPLARRLDVTDVLPRWSGEVLDLVVDFTTYVFIPAYAVAASGLMPDTLAIGCGMVIVVTGALYFADRSMKTTDNHFRGFPAVWNVIAFYLLLLRPAPWLAGATVVIFAVLTFLPVRFVHPFRVTRLRWLTVALLALWAVLAFVAVWQELEPPFWVNAALCVIAIYFLSTGLWPQRTPPLRDGHA
jgi:phosphatidylcholine synthase